MISESCEDRILTISNLLVLQKQMETNELTSYPLYNLADLLQKRAISLVELIDVF